VAKDFKTGSKILVVRLVLIVQVVEVEEEVEEIEEIEEVEGVEEVEEIEEVEEVKEIEEIEEVEEGSEEDNRETIGIALHVKQIIQQPDKCVFNVMNIGADLVTTNKVANLATTNKVADKVADTKEMIGIAFHVMQRILEPDECVCNVIIENLRQKC
jgi:hypothetical protein